MPAFSSVSVFFVLLLPFAAITFGMWLRHQRVTATLELLRRYVEQGKEAPAELLKSLDAGPDWSGWDSGSYKTRSQAWQGFVMFGSMAVGLALWGWFGPPIWPLQQRMSLFIAFVMGAVALGSLEYALLWRKIDDK